MPPATVNVLCPWSGKPVDDAAATRYRGHPVGFCNPGCRDKFDAATGMFDAAIGNLPPPPTLLDLAGAAKHPSRLEASVLLVIGAQQEYGPGALPLDGIGAALERLARLIARARQAGGAVMHARQSGPAGGLFDPGGAFLPEAFPLPGDFVFPKALPNAFAGTDLAQSLAMMDRPPLILAGFMTHMCVGATARAALDLGYAVTVAADATATRALPDALGGPAIPAPTVQAAALAALADRFASVVRVDAIPD